MAKPAKKAKNARKNTLIRARTPAKLTLQAEPVFARLGLSATEALNLYYAPNEQTLQTFNKTERGQDLHRARNANDLFRMLGI